MTFKEFDYYSQELMEKVVNVRDTKGKEYAGDSDRFDNFNRLAVKCGKLDRKLVWLVYFTKHIDAIESYINHGREFSTESIEGRIVDAITYLTLLAGMIKEEQNRQVERRNCIPVEYEIIPRIAIPNSPPCSCFGIAFPPHIKTCPVCKLEVAHKNVIED